MKKYWMKLEIITEFNHSSIFEVSEWKKIELIPETGDMVLMKPIIKITVEIGQI